MAKPGRSAVPSTGWIDISVPLRNGMVHWPGDRPICIELESDMRRGAPCNVSTLALNAHTGTHMDAPLHFVRDGASLDDLPLAAVVGPARVIAIDDPAAIRPEELQGHRLRKGERVLLRTRNSERCWRTDDFVEDFVHVTPAAARYLVERGVRTIGVDYLSVGGYRKGGIRTHQILLRAGVWIIEGLDLSRAAPGSYDLVCLPLRVLSAEGAPARAIVRRRTRAKRKGTPA